MTGQLAPVQIACTVDLLKTAGRQDLRTER